MHLRHRGIFNADFPKHSFAAYTSPIGNLVRSFGIHHRQFADDTQVHLALRSSDMQNGLTLLAYCTAAVSSGIS